MTKAEYMALINSIRTAQTEVERNNLLATLTADYDVVLAKQSEHSTKIEQLEKDNVEYAKLNNKLFLQLGAQEPQVTEPTVTEPTVTEPPQKRNFEDLTFD